MMEKTFSRFARGTGWNLSEYRQTGEAGVVNLLTRVGQGEIEIQRVTSGTKNVEKENLWGSAGRVWH